MDYLVENVQFFVMGVTPYYYDHGVYREDYEGVRLKYRIQKLIYRDQIFGFINVGIMLLRVYLQKKFDYL